ncbi:hypothetical protein [Xanthomonas citri]|uniref:hypothetical protein n=1 Tax=Xanthomonas citri TaxID=346 RepID=UPI003F7E0219
MSAIIAHTALSAWRSLATPLATSQRATAMAGRDISGSKKIRVRTLIGLSNTATRQAL